MIFADFEMFSFRFNAGDFVPALPLLLLLLLLVGVTDMLAANLKKFEFSVKSRNFFYKIDAKFLKKSNFNLFGFISFFSVISWI
jgi:hypothetical protein